MLIIQWLFIIYGAFCTYNYVGIKTSSRLVALFALVYYFIIFNRFSAYQADCNLAIIGAAALPVFLYYFESKKYVPTLIVYLFLLVNREDFPLTLAFLSLFLMITNHKEKSQFKFATLLFVSSIAAFCISFYIIIPLVESSDKKFSLFNYSALGQTPLEALSFVLNNPVKAFSYLFINHTTDVTLNNIKSSFYIVYGLSGGLLLLLRPAYLVCLVPLVAKKMFNDSYLRWGYDMYYSIEIVSLLPILVFSIISLFKSDKIQILTSVVVCLITIVVSWYCMVVSTRWDFSNSKYNFLSAEFYKPIGNISQINSLLSKIPKDASVSADGKVLPHIAFRKKIYLYPKIEEADYLCICLDCSPYPIGREEYNNTLNTQIGSRNWRVEAATGNLILFKRIER